jgi:hypothetical protein
MTVLDDEVPEPRLRARQALARIALKRRDASGPVSALAGHHGRQVERDAHGGVIAPVVKIADS